MVVVNEVPLFRQIYSELNLICPFLYFPSSPRFENELRKPVRLLGRTTFISCEMECKLLLKTLSSLTISQKQLYSPACWNIKKKGGESAPNWKGSMIQCLPYIQEFSSSGQFSLEKDISAEYFWNSVSISAKSLAKIIPIYNRMNNTLTSSLSPWKTSCMQTW